VLDQRGQKSHKKAQCPLIGRAGGAGLVNFAKLSAEFKKFLLARPLRTARRRANHCTRKLWHCASKEEGSRGPKADEGLEHGRAAPREPNT